MLRINCSICEKELEEPGGLIFSPPFDDDDILVDEVCKEHVCVKCWEYLITSVNMLRDKAKKRNK